MKNKDQLLHLSLNLFIGSIYKRQLYSEASNNESVLGMEGITLVSWKSAGQENYRGRKTQ